jgi:hypothetical protein
VNAIQKHKELLKVFHIFQKKLPTKRHVILEYRNCGDYGICEVENTNNSLITIIINNHLGILMQLEILIHEYAHALAFDKTMDNKNDHNSEWGRKYALVYRIFERDYLLK